MIRLAAREDRKEILGLCAHDPWNGTEVLTAYLALCADRQNVDWRCCDIWIGASESQLHVPQYLLCRIGGSYRMVGAPHSPARWEELRQFLSLQLPGKLIADGKVLEEFAVSCSGTGLSDPAPQMLCGSRLGLWGEDDRQIQECQSLWPGKRVRYSFRCRIHSGFRHQGKHPRSFWAAGPRCKSQGGYQQRQMPYRCSGK